ncbi:MAG: hypothetical protein ACE5GJ_09590 [Gemmatimonadota bacterium]
MSAFSSKRRASGALTPFLLFPFAMAGWADPAQGQDRIRVDIYHGLPDRSGIVRVVTDGEPRPFDDSDAALWANQGARICTRVVNPHPVNYSYGVGDSVVAAQTSLPSVVDLGEVLFGGAADAKAVEAAYGLRGARTGVTQYFWEGERRRVAEKTGLDPLMTSLGSAQEALRVLAQDLKTGQKKATGSDAPLPAAEAEGSSAYAQAQAWFRGGWPAEPGRIGDPQLGKTLDGFAAGITGSAGSLAEEQKPLAAFTAAAVKALGQSYVRQRDEMAGPYTKGSATFQQCKTLGDKALVLAVRAASTDTSATRARQTGKIAEVSVRPNYKRPKVELVPVGYMVGARNVSEFAVTDGVISVKEDDEKFEIRAGLMLGLNVFAFGEGGENALAVGLGSNLLGGEDVLSELFGAVYVSHQDALRIGLGWGRADFPTRLKASASVGQALPQGQTLAEVLENDDKRAFFLIFSVTGWTVPGLPGN